MDELRRPSGLSRIESSVLSPDGLVLWRLSAAGQSDLWCLVFEFPDAFYFVLEDDPHGNQPPRVTERHTEIGTVLHRADVLKRALLRCGWTDTDVD
jgi:hypothetical protein